MASYRYYRQYIWLPALLIFFFTLLVTGKFAVSFILLGLLAVFVLFIALFNWLDPFMAGCLAAGLLCSLFITLGAKNELTGHAVYSPGPIRSSRSELVTKADALAKFREATNHLWGAALLLGTLSGSCYLFYRKSKGAARIFIEVPLFDCIPLKPGQIIRRYY